MAVRVELWGSLVRVEFQSEAEDGGYGDEDEVEDVMCRAAGCEFGTHRKGCGIAYGDIGFVGDLEVVIPSVAEQGPTQLMTQDTYRVVSL